MKDRDGEAPDCILHGDALKKVVRKGRSRPLPFAFVPEFGDDESLFAVHRKRKPESLARTLRLATGQSRVAWGTFTVVGRVMVLTCLLDLPGIAQKLKRHMRLEKIRVDIRVLDQSGRELEADVDPGGDGEDPFGPADDTEDDEDDDDASDRRRAAGRRAAADDPVGARIAELRPVVMAATGLSGDRLRDLFAALLRAQEGRHPAFPMLLDRLEDEVRALCNSVRRPQGLAPPRRTARGTEGGRPAETAEAAQAAVRAPGAGPSVARGPGPDLGALRAETIRLARGVAVLRRRIGALDDADAARRLTAALEIAASAIRSGDLGPGAEAARQVADALRRVEAGKDGAGKGGAGKGAP